jgi:hypothetical protein
MRLLIATLLSLLFAGFATADTVTRTNMPVEGGAYVWAVLVNTGGSLAYITSDAALKGRAPATDFRVIVDNDLDLYDPDAVVAYAEAAFGDSFEAVFHGGGSRVFAGLDGIFGTADDEIRTSRIYW